MSRHRGKTDPSRQHSNLLLPASRSATHPVTSSVLCAKFVILLQTASGLKVPCSDQTITNARGAWHTIVLTKLCLRYFENTLPEAPTINLCPIFPYGGGKRVLVALTEDARRLVVLSAASGLPI